MVRIIDISEELAAHFNPPERTQQVPQKVRSFYYLNIALYPEDFQWMEINSLLRDTFQIQTCYNINSYFLKLYDTLFHCIPHNNNNKKKKLQWKVCWKQKVLWESTPKIPKYSMALQNVGIPPQCYMASNPKDHSIHLYCYKNLKSHIYKVGQQPLHSIQESSSFYPELCGCEVYIKYFPSLCLQAVRILWQSFRVLK